MTATAGGALDRGPDRLFPALLAAAVAILVVLALVAGCASSPPAPAPPPPLVLVGLDGFRWDFLGRAPTPALDRIAAAGVRAERMIPVFPTKTFPNHYTMVTGLYPAHHGIVANNIYDPQLDRRFALADREAVEDPRWWHGEPLWLTARRQGRRAASFFWPGSEAPIQGQHPHDWRIYDGSIPNHERVDQVLAWLDQPAAERPSFITVYFSDVDDAAHDHGPDSAPVGAAVAAVDQVLGRLLAGIDERGLWGKIHLLVVSDHGVAATPPDQVILLDDLVDLEIAGVVDWTPLASLWPRADDLEEVHQSLAGAHPHLSVYRREELPARFHYRDSPRIAPLLALADPGWRIASRADLERHGGELGRGDHGYDNQALDMGALFVAAGPGVRRGLVVPPFSNIHLYELMCHLLGLEPADNDGDLEALRHLLRG